MTMILKHPSLHIEASKQTEAFDARTHAHVEHRFADRSFADTQQNYLYRRFYDDCGMKRPTAKVDLSKRFSLDDFDIRVKRPTLGVTTDVDGVMYPEKAVIDAVMDASKAHGINLSRHQAESFNGMTPDARKKRLEDVFNGGRKLPDDFNAKLNTVILKKQETTQFEDGAKNAYTMLALMGVPVGRTTSSSRQQMYTKDKAAGLKPPEGAMAHPKGDTAPRILAALPGPAYSFSHRKRLFVSNLTRDDIPDPKDRKPSPVPHRTTATHLQTRYDISVVTAVEDSQSGVRSGHEVPGHVVMVDNEGYKNDADRIAAHNKILRQVGVKEIDLKAIDRTTVNHTVHLHEDIDAHVTVIGIDEASNIRKASPSHSPVRYRTNHEPKSKVLELALLANGHESSIIIAEEPHVRELHNVTLHLQSKLASDFSAKHRLNNVRTMPKLSTLQACLDR